MRRRIMIIVLLGVIAVGVWLRSDPALAARLPITWAAVTSRPPSAALAGPLVASGVITAREVALSFPVGGRLAQISVREGDTVAPGQELAMLDRALFARQMVAARAQVAVAEATLAQAQQGARPGQIAVAEAELAQARAAESAARAALDDLRLLREMQQELGLQIALAEAQLTASEKHLAAATAAKDATTSNKDFASYLQQRAENNWPYPKPLVVPLSLQLAPYEWWKAWANVNAAQANAEGQRSTLAHLRDLRSHPQELDARISAAQAAITHTLASVAGAQARLDGLRAGSTPEQLGALQAQLDRARASADALERQESDLTMRAPLSASVTSLIAHEGEVVAAGASTVVVADLREVTLRVFVPEPRLGQVSVGQGVSASVDGRPEQPFRGQVTRIADRAEYTPRNIATQEGRMLTYYAVEIRLPNEELLLKPGMPADATFDALAATSR